MEIDMKRMQCRLTPSWFSRPTPAGLGLNSPEPPVGIWLATASMLLLVEDMLFVLGDS